MTKKSLLFLLPALFLSSCAEKPLPVGDDEGPAVGTISLFACDGSSETTPGTLNMGHAFVVFENTSAASWMLGNYEVQPQEEVSVGSWSLSAHYGVWYNVESSYVNIFNRYLGRVSLTVDITAGDIKAVSSYIADHDKWSMFKNCSYLALALFNICSPASFKLSLSGTITPKKVSEALKSNAEVEYDRSISNYGEIGYFQDGVFYEFEVEDHE